jgi:hypothetical protein
MKTRSFSLSKLVVVSMLLNAAAGCNSGSSVSESPLPSGDGEEASASTLIALTPIDPVSSPVLHRLSLERDVVDAAGLETLDRLRGELGAGDTVALDLDKLDEADVAEYQEFLESARESGVAIVLENVRSEEMARLLGVGVDGEAVLVRPLPGANRSEVKVYSGPEDTVTLAPTHKEITWQKTALLDAYVAMNAEERAAFAADVGMDVAAVDELAEQAMAGQLPLEPEDREEELREIVLSPEVLGADEIALDIAEHLPAAGGVAAQVIGGTGNLPAKSYWSTYVNMSPYTYKPQDATKTASVDIDLEVQLMAVSQPSGKYLVLSSAGAGMTSGGMTWDYKGSATKDGRRGWYQEFQQYTITPTSIGGGSANLANYRHAPDGTNSSGTFSKDTGCGITASVPPAFSCAAGSSASQTLSDFGVIDESSGMTTGWSFKMMSCGGGGYSSWNSLVDNTWGGLHGVPNLAKSTMAPQFQAIYRSNTTYTGAVTMQRKYHHQLRDVRSDGKLFVQKNYMQGWQANGTMSVTVNFGGVKL